MNEAAAVELQKVHLACHPGTRCADLSFADRQMVEIAKALSLDSRIKGDITILLDEPTSVLEKKEIELLFEIMRDLKQRASIVFISHRLEEVLEISDRVYVMRDGKVVKELPAKEATVKDLHQHMVGRQLHHEYYREARQARADGKSRSRVPATSARTVPSTISASPCMKARSSALPASSARAARIWPAASQATLPADRGTLRVEWRHCAVRRGA